MKRNVTLPLNLKKAGTASKEDTTAAKFCKRSGKDFIAYNEIKIGIAGENDIQEELAKMEDKVILSIDFDQTITTKHSANGLFVAKDYYKNYVKVDNMFDLFGSRKDEIDGNIAKIKEIFDTAKKNKIPVIINTMQDASNVKTILQTVGIDADFVECEQNDKTNLDPDKILIIDNKVKNRAANQIDRHSEAPLQNKLEKLDEFICKKSIRDRKIIHIDDDTTHLGKINYLDNCDVIIAENGDLYHIIKNLSAVCALVEKKQQINLVI